MTCRLILAACGLSVFAFAANGQSLRERLREARDGAREAATSVKQEAGAQVEKAVSNDASAATQSTAPTSAAPAAQRAVPGGAVIDIEPYLRQATAIGNECRTFPDNQFKPGCLKQCDDTAAILSRAREQVLPPGAEAQVREAVRLCGVMRDYAKDPNNAGR